MGPLLFLGLSPLRNVTLTRVWALGRRRNIMLGRLIVLHLRPCRLFVSGKAASHPAIDNVADPLRGGLFTTGVGVFHTGLATVSIFQ